MKRFNVGILVTAIIVTLCSWTTSAKTLDVDVVEAANETSAKLELTSKSAILMEESTGTVIYEQNPDEKLSPASITKIMTLILTFEALEQGKINLEDMVTTSAYAKSMGGSQVFLEEGEQQTVETMIKCIVIASGNDASVAMAEHISGSEGEFIAQMNKRAKDLGMSNTNFEDCCGLTDSKNHYSTARDVAIMSRELSAKYPQIHNYSTIWMENITHVTPQGTKEFGLSNTNKLLKQYEWATGLKTGSTSLAKYCVAATASKNGINLIAVVMAAPDYKVRFSEAISMFNYGYANCKLYNDQETGEYKSEVLNGADDQVSGNVEKQFSYLSTTGENVENVKKEVVMDEIKAPIRKGDVIGKIIYKIGEQEIGSVKILSQQNVEEKSFFDYIKTVWRKYLLN